MVRYIEKVLVPWAEQRKRDLRLPQSQKAIVVLDVFRAHSTTDVLNTLKENDFRIVFVPGNCTSELQPLDLSVNGPFKVLLQDRFNNWYAELVAEAIHKHPDDFAAAAAAMQPDLCLQVLKS